MTIMMVMVMIIIITALKGAIRVRLRSPHCAANCLQHVRARSPGAIVCKPHATYRTQEELVLGYHGGRRPSSDDSFHSPTVIPPSAFDKPSIMKCYHRPRTCSHASPRRSPTMVTFHDTQFVECRWWNDGWTVKTRYLTVVGLHDTGP